MFCWIAGWILLPGATIKLVTATLFFEAAFMGRLTCFWDGKILYYRLFYCCCLELCCLGFSWLWFSARKR